MWEKQRKEGNEGEKDKEEKKHDREGSFALEQVSSGVFEAFHVYFVHSLLEVLVLTVFSASLQGGFDKVIFTMSHLTLSTVVRRPIESCVMSAIYTQS